MKILLQTTLCFLTLFLASCNFNETYVRIFTSKTSTQALKVIQTEEIAGGFSEQKAEAGIYSCEYGNVVFASHSCDTLDHFNFDNTKGRFRWTPSYQQVGHYRVVIQSPKGNKSVTVIAVEKKNEAPVLSLANMANTALENSVYSVDLEATDINEDELTYSYECLSNNCEFLKDISLDDNAKTFSFSTDYESEGSYSFLLKVSDGTLEDSKTVDVDVLNVNRAPVLTAIGNKSVDENALLSFDLETVDLDGDAVTFSCGATCPVGMSISGANVSWTPTYSQGGNYNVTFTATDGILSQSETIEIAIRDMNRAPVLDAIGNQTVKELESIVSINAGDSGDDFDIDSEAITYSCYYDMTVDGSVALTNLCSSLNGLSFNTSTGQLAWTTAPGSPGSYELKLIASDGQLSDTKIFTITVTSAYPLILTYKTSINNDTIILPIDGSFSHSYNFKVDWGDGSGLLLSGSHQYATAGTYVVRIYGTFPYIAFNYSSFADKNKLIEVNDLGRVGLVSLKYAFNGCANLIKFQVGDGDTSNVTTMQGMFAGASKLNSINLEGLDTGKVTNMSYMFADASNLTSLNLKTFNTEKVTSMDYMFYGMSKLASLDLSNFNTANVTSMSNMFALLQLTELDLLSFNTAKVTTMRNMFSSSSKLTRIKLSNFDTSNVTDMSNMFSGLSSLTELDLTNFNTAKVTNMGYMFGGASNLIDLNISSFTTTNVSNMGWMFYGVSKLPSLDLGNFDTSNVTDMNNMFNSTAGLTSLDLSTFDTSKVTNMSYMFANMTSSSTIDLSHFNTEKVTDMSGMFAGSSGYLSLDLSGFNTVSVTNMSRMFEQNKKLQQLILPNASAENVTDMAYMFAGATSLTSLDFSNFTTLKLTNMSWMFQDATGLTNINFSGINTTNVVNMTGMFSGASGLINLDLSYFNTANVTDMSSMFRGTLRLVSLNLSSFNTSKVTSMISMFNNTGLEALDLSSFDVRQTINMTFMFMNASKLTNLNLRGWTRTSAPSTSYIFQGTPANKVVYCTQNPMGNYFGVVCAP